MKNYYLLFFLISSAIGYGQTNCDDANSYLVSAYSHVKNAYKANNISHLKYYANRSVESFKLAKKTLSTCGCETALNLANKGVDLLVKVEYTETFEDGRFYVKRARDISKESVIEIDKCSASNSVDTTTEGSELTDLQNEQLKLKQLQKALKLKEEQLKTKLAKQKEKEFVLKKKQLIISYKNAIALHIKTYNETLKICDCNHESLKGIATTEDMLTKSIKEIKIYYTDTIKSIASNYLSQLNLCDI